MPRPRSFDEDHVVASAMDLFWKKGFEGTSLDALEEATGLNRSSLYNAFGGKLQLFRKVLDAYRDGPCRLMEYPLREQRGAVALRGYLDEVRAFVVAPGSDRGCMMVNTARMTEVDPSTRRRVRTHFAALRRDLRRAFAEALQDGSIETSLDPVEGADWLLVFVRGVLSSAASGEPKRGLVRALDAAAKHLDLA